MSKPHDPFSFDVEFGDPDRIIAAVDLNRAPATGPEWTHCRAAEVPVKNGPTPFDFDDAPPEEFADPAPPEEEPYSNSDIDSRKLTVTFIKDETGAEMRRVDMTLPELAGHVRFQTAASKMALPWLKLAIFGNRRSEKNSLRTNENVEQITGIEGEHDAGEIAFDAALATVLNAGIRCILYTSPSYVPGVRERWRILAPLSQHRTPEAREKMVARVNGLFAGKLAPESFVLSQGYLYGSVNNNPDHRVEVIDGRFLDLCDDLYAGSIFKDGGRVGGNGNGACNDFNGAAQSRSRKDDDPEPVDRDRIEAALNVISSDCAYKTVWMPIGGALHYALGEAGFELFDRWSARAKGFASDGTPRYTAEKCLESWRGFRSLREYTTATIFHFADQADPGWRQRYEDKDQLRIFARMAKGAGASNGAGTSSAHDDACDDDFGPGPSPAGASPPPLVSARPFVLRDPRTLPKRQWLYGRHLIRKFASATFAPSGSGKTNTFIVEALAMATGRALLGVLPGRRLRVWMWNGEDPYDELERRVGAACLHYGITAAELDGWLFVNSGRDKDSKIIIATETRNGVVIAVPVVEALIQTIRDNRIDVVQIDPFISSHRVSENNNNAIDAVAKTYSSIADITDTGFDLGHHTRKTGGAEVTVEDGRGAVALLNAVRPARVLNGMTEDEAKKAGVSDNRRRYFKVTDGKNNLSLPVDRLDWFRSATVNLGNGDDPGNLLGTGDDMGVVTKWEWPDPLAGMTGADFERVAVAIRAGKWRKDVQAKDWVGKAMSKVLKLNLGDKADKAKVKGLIEVWLNAGSLVEVEGLDDKRRPKTFVEVAEED